MAAAMNGDNKDKRSAVRSRPVKPILVNGHDPAYAGYLRDVSVGGAAVEYAPEEVGSEARAKPGDTMQLIMRGPTGIICDVVRVFDGGYAVQFRVC